ncbi:MAG: hypothetical protein ABS949_16555 [Solibacillus sp.]
MSADKNQLEEKINELQQQTKFYVTEFRELIKQLPVQQTSHVISYFTTSFNISHTLHQENLCLGSLHIWNIGTVPLTNLSLTIQLPEDSPFSFTGRYVYKHFPQKLKQPNEWLRIKNTDKKDIFSFQPLERTTLQPNEKISFDNFQIKWLSTSSYSGSITGFTYCDQFPDGVSVINPINLSVIRLEQEE